MLPSSPCPHCYEENPVFGPQRCANCGLNMRSDRAQAQLTQLAPKARKLDEVLQKVQTGEEAEKNATYAHALLAELNRAKGGLDAPGLDPWLVEANGAVAAYPKPRSIDEAKRRRYVWWLNLAILAILGLFPLVLFTLQAPAMVIILTLLPFLAWLYIGVILFRRRRS